jgi:predicted transcriptional regulator
MKNQFFYTRREPIQDTDPVEFKEFTDSLNITKIIRSVRMDDENLVVLLDDIRSIMFDQTQYETTFVSDLMKSAPEIIFHNDSVEKIMQKFKDSGAWNLPVVKNEKYVGFISKSKLLSAYRNKLIEVTPS